MATNIIPLKESCINGKYKLVCGYCVNSHWVSDTGAIYSQGKQSVTGYIFAKELSC